MKRQNVHQVSNVKAYGSTNRLNEFTIEESAQVLRTRKAWLTPSSLLTRYARARVDIDVINYATKCTTKLKAKFSHCANTRSTRIAA